MDSENIFLNATQKKDKNENLTDLSLLGQETAFKDLIPSYKTDLDLWDWQNWYYSKILRSCFDV